MIEPVSKDMYTQKMMDKAAGPKDEMGTMTPRKMLDWGVITTWRASIDSYFQGGPIELDSMLAELQHHVGQEPPEVTKDYFVKGIKMATSVERYMQAGTIYAQVIKGYMFEHVFQYHQGVYGRGETRDWKTFVSEELSFRDCVAHRYRRLYKLVLDWPCLLFSNENMTGLLGETL